jgi:hypothetical protein
VRFIEQLFVCLEIFPSQFAHFFVAMGKVLLDESDDPFGTQGCFFRVLHVKIIPGKERWQAAAGE